MPDLIVWCILVTSINICVGRIVGFRFGWAILNDSHVHRSIDVQSGFSFACYYYAKRAMHRLVAVLACHRVDYRPSRAFMQLLSWYDFLLNFRLCLTCCCLSNCLNTVGIFLVSTFICPFLTTVYRIFYIQHFIAYCLFSEHSCELLFACCFL